MSSSSAKERPRRAWFASSSWYLTAARVLSAVVVLGACLLAFTPAWAKRGAPKPVPPVVVSSVEYSAPHDQMGFVVAKDSRSRQELWRVRIYTVAIDPLLERDVQDVFITSLAFEKGRLLITNETGEKYSLDPVTRQVARQP